MFKVSMYDQNVSVTIFVTISAKYCNQSYVAIMSKGCILITYTAFEIYFAEHKHS